MMSSFSSPHSRFFFVLVLGLSFLFSGLDANRQLQMSYHIVPRKLDAAAVNEIEKTIGYRFKNKELLVQALTTRAQNPETNYERLEFHGDAILEHIIIELLLHTYPAASEHALTRANNELTRQEALAALCLKLNLHKYLQSKATLIPISSLCDIIEALIAAIYNDGGAQSAQDFVLKFFTPMMRSTRYVPVVTAEFVKTVARELNLTIEYEWTGSGTCTIKSAPGTGEVSEIDKPEKRYDTKKDPVRLAQYLAEREFIVSQLPVKYRESLVCLATDAEYEPLPKAPALNIAWAKKMQRNYRERLQTLMAQLGRKCIYNFTEQPSDSARFSCTIEDPLFSGIITTGARKDEAAEKAAWRAYIILQTSIIFSQEFARLDVGAFDFDLNDPIVTLHRLCEMYHLKNLVYTVHLNSKHGIYAHLEAPWLHSTIKGPAKSTKDSAKEGAARQLLTLIQYLRTKPIEPSKLKVVYEGIAGESTNSLITVCRYVSFGEPEIKTFYCRGPVTEPLQFETEISLVDQHGANKTYTGEKAGSASQSQKSATMLARIHLINKLLKDEMQSNL